MSVIDTYAEFLNRKTTVAAGMGFPCEPGEVNPLLKPHQRDSVCWAVRGGRRALFEAFGLGKTFMQLEIVRLTLAKQGGTGAGLIVAPLGVRQEFKIDAEKLGIPITFVRTNAEVKGPGVFLTNYESVREGKIDPRRFTVVSLDEAACLRGFGGTKTFREFMAIFEGSGIHRFVATATPSPNEYIEILAYAAFLDIMDVAGAKTRFFKRDSTKADHLEIHPHKIKEFWLWLASWALFVQKPSDLGHSDEGYALPALDVRWHEVPSDHSQAQVEKSGQGRLLNSAAFGVTSASREKRDSLDARVQKMLQIREETGSVHRVIWHDLESERKAIEAAIPGIATVYGSQDLDAREALIIDFAYGKIPELAVKPSIAGAGCNFQRHCAHAIFLGIGFKFHEFVQALHRIHRFLQTKTVRIDLIYTEAEREIRAQLERKWQQHNDLVASMTSIIREYGLSAAALAQQMTRQMGVERVEASGKDWRLVNNDSVLECAGMPADSVDLILTSIPFSTQYEYSPNYADFGHTDDVQHFFRQMDFLSPNLLRVLRPGRIAAIHVKDRVTPGGLTGLGFQTVQPFHADCIAHYTKHGFAYLGMVTIVTDVVRENAQTYRLGWTEQCKDGSRMGVGMPEYLLLFRKPPTDPSRGYGDVPVVKSKDEYSRARWQFDAHGFHRSSGQRLLSAGDLAGCTHADIFKIFKQHSLNTVYDFERDVKIAEGLEDKAMLPPSFMLLQPQSWHPEVWTDITRMRTLNGVQNAKGKEMHLCPMQYDTADRAITQYTMKGETVFDPFAGLGTVPLRAVMLGRKGLGCELSRAYFDDACWHLRAMEAKKSSPTLFELEEVVEEARHV